MFFMFVLSLIIVDFAKSEELQIYEIYCDTGKFSYASIEKCSENLHISFCEIEAEKRFSREQKDIIYEILIEKCR